MVKVDWEDEDGEKSRGRDGLVVGTERPLSMPYRLWALVRASGMAKRDMRLWAYPAADVSCGPPGRCGAA